jgi:hypothetical protein
MRDLPNVSFDGWDNHRLITRNELIQIGRRNWFIRMAAKGFVPWPHVTTGKAALIAAVLPEYYADADHVRQCGWIKRERWDLLRENWPATCTPMLVHLPEAAIRVVVAALDARQGAQILLEHLPRGTRVE